MIEARSLSVGAGTFHLDGITFLVPPGQYGVLMGATGSGKTTLLETICGLKDPLTGQVILHGLDVTSWKPGDRGIGYVPQDGALFRRMTVRQHLSFALWVRRWSAEQIRERVADLTALVGVEHILDRRPHGLSGGESQRVALGRALSFGPEVLCLDEPLSALDDDSRRDLVGLLKRVQRETGVTVLHVTHNRVEAEILADYRLRIVEGRVVEAESFAV
jgi:ABC-type sugar transport system ATPase subunit